MGAFSAVFFFFFFSFAIIVSLIFLSCALMTSFQKNLMNGKTKPGVFFFDILQYMLASICLTPFEIKNEQLL